MSNKNVFILCRSKARNNSSALLENELLRMGEDVYRVTAAHVPLRRVESADVIINHGVSAVPIWMGRVRPDCKWLNLPSTVHTSANKLRTQRALEEAGVPCLEAVEDYNSAMDWLSEGSRVITRLRLGGSQGRGIVLSPPDRLPVHASLYTKVVEGEGVREYRVYIVNGHAIDQVQKRRFGRDRRERDGIVDNDYTRTIRAHRNGWVFSRNNNSADLETRTRINALAERAASAIGLGWGGIDIIVSGDDMRVVEPNTSIGLSGDGATTRILTAAICGMLDCNNE
jgi:glutathione synthase/RimK-type ligase-like ATP-grasp enzyme